MIVFATQVARADEGMWLPNDIDKIISAMKSGGSKLSAEQIYSVNHSSLKDAVVLFGSGCTGEVVSNNGLVLTNHHCGLGAIQSHSTVANDYLKNGFWAMNASQEITCQGLSVTFIVRMEDVTSGILNNIPQGTPELRKQKMIDSLARVIAIKAISGTPYDASVRPIYSGNQYLLVVTETFKDIRLVGAPPEAIGNFGGETDNWIWPRQTCDFSVFRIYANKENQPAAYSADNVPFHPDYFFPISLKGIHEGDFAMVYGFPGRTSEYISSYQINMIESIMDPERIALRNIRLKIWENGLNENDSVRIQYTSKYYGLGNAWKKWQGEILGLQRSNAIAHKQLYEAAFARQLATNPDWQNSYGQVLNDLKTTVDSMGREIVLSDYYAEGILTPEIFIPATILQPLVDSALHGSKNSADKMKDHVKLQLQNFYKNYSASVDQLVLQQVMDSCTNKLGNENLPPQLVEYYRKNPTDFSNYIFSHSMLDEKERTMNLLNDFNAKTAKKIEIDPAYQLAIACNEYFNEKISPVIDRLSNRLQSLNKLYMEAQMKVMKDRNFYPDATLTLRVSFGKMEGYDARDAVHYNSFTTLQGAIEKSSSSNPDYAISPKLIQLVSAKDYGRYSDTDGTMHTCFITNCHTSGGNSGSPMMNAKGELVGINFDRCWEGTMSDYFFDPDFCRNISVDIRYVLFIIDKYAGAGYLLNEMKIES